MSNGYKIGGLLGGVGKGLGRLSFLLADVHERKTLARLREQERLDEEEKLEKIQEAETLKFQKGIAYLTRGLEQRNDADKLLGGVDESGLVPETTEANTMLALGGLEGVPADVKSDVYGKLHEEEPEIDYGQAFVRIEKAPTEKAAKKLGELFKKKFGYDFPEEIYKRKEKTTSGKTPKDKEFDRQKNALKAIKDVRKRKIKTLDNIISKEIDADLKPPSFEAIERDEEIRKLEKAEKAELKLHSGVLISPAELNLLLRDEDKKQTPMHPELKEGYIVGRASKEKRNEAIKLLNDGKKLVTEANIQEVMRRLNAAD